MPRKSFSIHSDFYSELCALTAEQRGDVLFALIAWTDGGEAPVKRYVSNPELRTVLGNGITLCERCHRKLHKLEGC
jgi:hypothetical protein